MPATTGMAASVLKAIRTISRFIPVSVRFFWEHNEQRRGTVPNIRVQRARLPPFKSGARDADGILGTLFRGEAT